MADDIDEMRMKPTEQSALQTGTVTATLLKTRKQCKTLHQLQCSRNMSVIGKLHTR